MSIACCRVCNDKPTLFLPNLHVAGLRSRLLVFRSHPGKARFWIQGEVEGKSNIANGSKQPSDIRYYI
jgi:hypothetical protein